MTPTTTPATRPRPPLVSIGMSVRNNQDTLAQSLRSIVDQTYPHWELILIDDGSSDATLAVARRFAEADARIRLVADGGRKGLPARLNESIEAASGVYYARMDGDDVAYPRRLERQVDYLEAHRDVDLVGTWAIVFGAGGRALGKRGGAERHEQICARPHAGFPLIHPTYLGRIDYFRRNRYRAGRGETGGESAPPPIPGGLARGQDQDLLIRSYRSARFANVPEVLLGYREEGIDLNKVLASRYCLGKSFWYELGRQGRPVAAARAVAEQGLKALVDVFAVKTRLTDRLLRHRARPATAAEVQCWEQVWAGLQGA
jgi:glycosyltransferase involved in cell wall biosynthesis